jgi:cell division protein FtsB
MSLVREVRRRARYVIAPTLGLSAIGYFLVHSVEGDRGILAYLSIRSQIQRAESTLAETDAQRSRLEARVALMHGDALDRDMLDEQSRRLLGLMGEREIVIFEKPRPPRF